MAFVHAELSFCVSSRFCLSLWRWRSGRGKSSGKADLGTESRAERSALMADQVPWFRLSVCPPSYSSYQLAVAASARV